MNDSQSIKESVRRSGGLHIPPNMAPERFDALPESVRSIIREKVRIDDPDGSIRDEILFCMEGIYRQTRSWGKDLSQEDRETVRKFGKLLKKAADLWWESPALQRLAPGGDAGSPIHILEQGIDAVAWVADAYRPKLEQKRTVIRKVLFHWAGIGLPLPVSAITDKTRGTEAPPYVLCGIMLRAIFNEHPGDFSALYEQISRRTIRDSAE